MIEHAGQSYRQLADEIGAVLQAAAETAEKMQGDAQVEAARLRAGAEAEMRAACEEGRRILDEARMEADMVRAEADWQAQEILAQARRQAAERLAGADCRLAEMEQAQSRVLDRLAGVSQVLADALGTLRESPAGTGPSAPVATTTTTTTGYGYSYPPTYAIADEPDDADTPTAKVYFVEFPPAAAPEPPPMETPLAAGPAGEYEIVLPESADADLVATTDDRGEWTPPVEIPAWWTRGGAQG
jgi:hypothetical protein